MADAALMYAAQVADLQDQLHMAREAGALWAADLIDEEAEELIEVSDRETARHLADLIRKRLYEGALAPALPDVATTAPQGSPGADRHSPPE